MKNNVVFIALGLGMFFFLSCHKKDNTDPAPVTPATTPSVTDYFPMTSGSYWVYKQTEYDSSGNIMPQTFTNDTVIVKNDTIINSKTYHTFVEYNFVGQTTPFSRYFKDSADCIVDNHGKVIFSIKTPGLIYKELLSPDTIAYVNYYYNSGPTGISVPLGTYNCGDYRGELFRKMDNFSKAYLNHKYCCIHIGLIERTAMYVGGLNKFYFDLVAYHIQ